MLVEKKKRRVPGYGYAPLGVKSRDKGGRLHDYTVVERGHDGGQVRPDDWPDLRESVAPIGRTKPTPIVWNSKSQRARPHGSVEGDFSRAFLLSMGSYDRPPAAPRQMRTPGICVRRGNRPE